jgi:hypothetical protein
METAPGQFVVDGVVGPLEDEAGNDAMSASP